MIRVNAVSTVTAVDAVRRSMTRQDRDLLVVAVVTGAALSLALTSTTWAARRALGLIIPRGAAS